MNEPFDKNSRFKPVWRPSAGTGAQNLYDKVPEPNQEKRKFPGRNQRTEDRINVDLRAAIGEIGGGKYETWVCDLSRTGFRIELLTALDTSRPLMVHLPGLLPLRVHVAWQRSDQFGLRFDKPLHVAVFDHLAKIHTK